MAKYKSLVSTLFIYNKICENVKKLENFEISTYLSEKFFSRVQNFSRGGRGLRTLRLRFLEGEGSKHPLRTLDGCADLLGGGKPNFEFLGGVLCTPAHPRAYVWANAFWWIWNKRCREFLILASWFHSFWSRNLKISSNFLGQPF